MSEEGEGGHARMRERRHRSPPLCHSGEFNEKIWAVKGRRRAVCHCGRLSIYLAFKHLADALVQSNSVWYKKKEMWNKSRYTVRYRAIIEQDFHCYKETDRDSLRLNFVVHQLLEKIKELHLKPGCQTSLPTFKNTVCSGNERHI